MDERLIVAADGARPDPSRRRALRWLVGLLAAAPLAVGLAACGGDGDDGGDDEEDD